MGGMLYTVTTEHKRRSFWILRDAMEYAQRQRALGDEPKLDVEPVFDGEGY